jgi:hypothetical protein
MSERTVRPNAKKTLQAYSGEGEGVGSQRAGHAQLCKNA